MTAAAQRLSHLDPAFASSGIVGRIKTPRRKICIPHVKCD